MPAQRKRTASTAYDGSEVPGDMNSASSSTPPAAKKKVQRLPKGLTCANCRERKTRCDGGQPGCKTCEVYKDTCRYDKLPPLTQIMDLARRLQEAEATISQMRDEKGGGRSHEDHMDRHGEARDSMISAMDHPEPHMPIPGPSGSRRQMRQMDHVARDRFVSGSGYSTPAEPDGGMVESDLRIDPNGQVSYHGPTSSVHQPFGQFASHGPDYVEEGDSTKEDVKRLLTSKAREVRAWQDFALGNAALRCQIPISAMTRLLKLHTTWIAPQFCWVYQPAFFRDMATQGPYFSQFLLTVLCAHAARYQGDTAIRDLLTQRAEMLLGTEIIKASSVPTAQALLQMSARETAFGRFSQAWLYSGMAFRMVSDLGLQHSHGRLLRLGNLNSEDLEIRRRLFWSCYFWDKTLSLYMGRMPVLVDTPFDHEPELLDVSSETELWSPMLEDSSRAQLPEYIPQPSHAPSCFANSCKLAVIINDIMQQLYSRRHRQSGAQGIREIHARLESWRANLPRHLQCNPDYLPALSPPPHILTTNLLYYTTIILLHRPFYSNSSHRAICRDAAFDIESLLGLLVRTFGHDHITYLQAYCIYTAGSVLVKDVNAGDLLARQKMDTLLGALHGGLKTCPILQRSIDIIENSLIPRQPPPVEQPMNPGSSNVRAETMNLGPDRQGQTSGSGAAMPVPTNPTWSFDGSNGNGNQRSIIPGSQGYQAPPPGNQGFDTTLSDMGLPAFPFLDGNLGGFQNNPGANFDPGTLDLFSLLDSFPEANMSQNHNEEPFSWLNE